MPTTMPASPHDGVEQCALAGRRRHRPGEQDDPRAALVAAEHAPGGEVAEHVGDRPVVLGGEDLGGGEERGLAARVDDSEHRPERDDRLAGADLALEQPVHRVVAGEVVGDLRSDNGLPGGERERQPFVERLEQPTRPRHARRRLLRTVDEPAAGEGDLEDERLLEAEPTAGGPVVLGVVRPVDLVERLGDADEPVPRTDVGGDRVLERRQRRELHLHAAGDGG